MTQLVTGFTIEKLLEHLDNKKIDLNKALSETPCLVFRPLTGGKSPVFSSDNVGQPISSIFKMSETDNLGADEQSSHAYISMRAVVAPLWKSKRNSFKEIISIGRSGDCDIRINSPQVSKTHALFAKDETGIWTITDNCSTNGTRVNNILLRGSESFKLSNNSEICVGDIHALFLTREGLAALCNFANDIQKKS